jgi:hypothetical protein
MRRKGYFPSLATSVPKRPSCGPIRTQHWSKITRPPGHAPQLNPHSARSTAATHFQRFRALALFGRRPPRRVVRPSSRRPKTCTLAAVTATVQMPLQSGIERRQNGAVLVHERHAVPLHFSSRQTDDVQDGLVDVQPIIPIRCLLDQGSKATDEPRRRDGRPARCLRVPSGLRPDQADRGEANAEPHWHGPQPRREAGLRL